VSNYAVGALVIRTQQLMNEAQAECHVGAALSLLASMPMFLPMFFQYLLRFTMPGMRAVSMMNAEFSVRGRYAERGTADDDSRRLREKEMAEYVARQMARGRKR
jgi:hypothetical protein